MIYLFIKNLPKALVDLFPTADIIIFFKCPFHLLRTLERTR